MKGKLKALGLALVAAMAMSAVAAGSASAEPYFHIGAADENTVSTLTVKALETQRFTTTLGELTCKEVSLEEPTDTVKGKTVTQITARPKYSNDCTAVSLGVSTHIKMNSCDYLFTSTTTKTTTASEEEHAEVHIECQTPGDEIAINVTFLGERPCMRVPPQTPTDDGVTYKNETYLHEGTNVWDVKITPTVKGITYTEVAKSLCNGGSEAITGHDGEYTGAVTVKADNSEGTPIDITWGT